MIAPRLVREYLNGVPVLHVLPAGRVRLLQSLAVEDEPHVGGHQLLAVAVGVDQLSEGRARLDLELDDLSVLPDHLQVELLGVGGGGALLVVALLVLVGHGDGGGGKRREDGASFG